MGDPINTQPQRIIGRRTGRGVVLLADGLHGDWVLQKQLGYWSHLGGDLLWVSEPPRVASSTPMTRTQVPTKSYRERLYVAALVTPLMACIALGACSSSSDSKGTAMPTRTAPVAAAGRSRSVRHRAPPLKKRPTSNRPNGRPVSGAPNGRRVSGAHAARASRLTMHEPRRPHPALRSGLAKFAGSEGRGGGGP